MYLLLKYLHIAAVIAFLGNIVTVFFWHRHAWRTREPKLIAHTVNGIIRSDRVFTQPAVLVLLAAGIGGAMLGRMPVFRTGWILWTVVLFVLAGLVFAARVGPLQKQMLALANAATDGGAFDEAGYASLFARQQTWGAVALVALIAAVGLMVFRPAL